MLDLILLLGLVIVGTGVFWLVAQAIILGGGLLEQVLEWFVYGRPQDAKLLWPWNKLDLHEER